MLRSLALLLPLGFLLGCPATGNNYPAQYAGEYCRTLYTCVEDHDSIDDSPLLDYDDENDCQATVQADLEDTTDYEEWEAGNREFDADNATACLDEVAEVRDEDDCGDWNLLEWGLAMLEVSCTDPYTPVE